MSDLTPETLAELRRLAEAATPGPWYLDGPWWYGDDDSAYCISTAEDAGRIAVTIAPPGYMLGGEREVRDANARFIAAANPAAVLALLDDADALRAELAHMREARDNARAEVKRLTAQVERVRALADEWTYNGEFGWDDGSHAYGTDCVVQALDYAAAKLRRALDEEPQP